MTLRRTIVEDMRDVKSIGPFYWGKKISPSFVSGSESWRRRGTGGRGPYDFILGPCVEFCGHLKAPDNPCLYVTVYIIQDNSQDCLLKPKKTK